MDDRHGTQNYEVVTPGVRLAVGLIRAHRENFAQEGRDSAYSG